MAFIKKTFLLLFTLCHCWGVAEQWAKQESPHVLCLSLPGCVLYFTGLSSDPRVCSWPFFFHLCGTET